MLWVNSPSVFIGKHQNVRAETKLQWLEKEGISLIRRLSGGGTVYHDLGNLNFTVIRTEEQPGLGFDYAAIPRIVVDAFRRMEIELEQTQRGDLRYQGYKVAGSAEMIRSRRLLYHMSILYKADLDRLGQAIEPEDPKALSRVPSVRSKVMNLSELLPSQWEMADFKRLLEQEISLQRGYLEPIELPEEAEVYVSRAIKDRYKNPRWQLYGESPKY